MAKIAVKQKTEEKQKVGRCVCGSGQFSLVVKNHELVRTCKKCGKKVTL